MDHHDWYRAGKTLSTVAVGTALINVGDVFKPTGYCEPNCVNAIELVEGVLSTNTLTATVQTHWPPTPGAAGR